MFELDKLPIRRKAWVKTASIPKARLGWTLGDCTDAPETALKPVKSWLKLALEGEYILKAGGAKCGRGILFYGEPGRGKTTIALALIQEIMTTFPIEAFMPQEGKVIIRPCYFSTFNSLLDLKGKLMDNPTDSEETLYEGILGEAKDDAYNVRVLVIDDIGKEHTTLSGWQSNMLHHVLRTRFNNGLPTIVTSNIEKEDWAASYGEATGSFIKEAFLYIPVNGSRDLR